MRRDCLNVLAPVLITLAIVGICALAALVAK